MTATQAPFRIVQNNGCEGLSTGPGAEVAEFGGFNEKRVSWGVLAPSAASCYPYLPAHQPTPAQMCSGLPVSPASPSTAPGGQTWGVSNHSHNLPAPYLQRELGSAHSGEAGRHRGSCFWKPTQLAPQSLSFQTEIGIGKARCLGPQSGGVRTGLEGSVVQEERIEMLPFKALLRSGLSSVLGSTPATLSLPRTNLTFVNRSSAADKRGCWDSG